MCIEELLKALSFYDMNNIFDIIPEQRLQRFKIKFDSLFVQQTGKQKFFVELAGNPTDVDLITFVSSAYAAIIEVEHNLESIEIKPTNLIQDLNEVWFRQS